MTSFVTITGCWGLKEDSPVKMWVFFTRIVLLCCRWGSSVGHRRVLQGDQTTQTKAKNTKKPTADSGIPGLQSHLPSTGKHFSVHNAGVTFKIITDICDLFYWKDLPWGEGETPLAGTVNDAASHCGPDWTIKRRCLGTSRTLTYHSHCQPLCGAA